MWNQRYAGDELLFGEAPNDYLRAQAPRLPRHGRALCVADGEGRNSVWLARQGLQVQAFDISPVGVAKARALAARAGVQVDYEVADCDSWAWPEATFDVLDVEKLGLALGKVRHLPGAQTGQGIAKARAAGSRIDLAGVGARSLRRLLLRQSGAVAGQQAGAQASSHQDL